MPSSSSSERPSPAATAPAACLPAPAAAKQGMGTCSMQAQDLLRFVRSWRLMPQDSLHELSWRHLCAREAGYIISGDYCTVPGYAVPGNETRGGRTPVHATPAKRKAAYRAAKARIDYTDSPEIVAKLQETAIELDCSVNELLRSMVRFAQTNRNWKQLGLFGARKDGVLQ